MASIVYEHPCDLLLRDHLADDEVQALLAPAGFADWRAAHASLRRMAKDLQVRPVLADGLPHLLTTLANVANPDRALVNFERFVNDAANRPGLCRQLFCNPRAIEILAVLFAGSQFLTEILLRNPDYFERLTDLKSLAQPKSVEQFSAEAQAAIVPFTEVDAQRDALRRFQRWELLRIGACDLFTLLDLPTVTAQLSHLADSLVRVCLTIAATQSHTTTDGFAVIALGKLGGEELNYSSDIDLLFIAASPANGYARLGQRLIEALADVTAEGFLYRVDMRLRPWGRSGALVSSLDGYIAYLRDDARMWEKQALLKARVIAGAEMVGQAFLRRVQPLIFDATPEAVQAEVHGMKQRIEAELRRRGQEWGEVKLGEGSIRDIEFVTQYLQLVHGAQHPQVRSPNTLDALARLFTGGFLSPDEYRVLTDGYVFLRTVEHYLQMMHHQQTHRLPRDARELTYLGRRLGFQYGEPGTQLVKRYQQHSTAIRAVYQRHLDFANLPPAIPHPNPEIRRHLARMDPSYAVTFSAPEIARHAALAEQLDQDNLVQVDAIALGDNHWRVTIVGYDYLGELSLICGLLFTYGFDIIDGDIFTYEPVLNGIQVPERPTTDDRRPPYERRSAAGRSRSRMPRGDTRRKIVAVVTVRAGPRALPPAPGPSAFPRPDPPPRHTPPPPNARARAAGRRRSRMPREDTRRKIVDVFTVRAVHRDLPPDLWSRYAADLAALIRRLWAGEQREAQGELAKRVAVSLREPANATEQLYPIDIEIDNDASERYTILRIDTPDTIGFLYEFTNALALNHIHIARVTVETIGNRVQDTLYVTDVHWQKITTPEKQRELRAAIVLVKHFTHLLPQTPDPESALLHFHQFVSELFQRPGWPDEIASLERPEVLEALARLLGVIDFLWNDFLGMQHAYLFPVVRDVDALATWKSREQLQAELEAALQSAPDGEARRAALNAFKDRQMFRVDMRHILGHITKSGQFSMELTDVAEVVVDAAYRLCDVELRARFGRPCLEDGTPCPLSVCGLGKAGGRELGFASDIELMFIYAGNGKTTGPEVISTAEFYDKLAREVAHAIQAKREGVFEIDLRLRPYGRAGSMAVSLDSFRHYFAPGGAAWPYERQALVKLRPMAGDAAFGAQIVTLRDELVYTGEPFDVAAMRAMRQRQIRQRVTAGTFNAKFSPGGLVDVEYLVQGLQITHGHCDPSLRLTNTREAIAALANAGILSPQDYPRLRDAHVFLRRLINALRMVRGNAKDLTVPRADSEDFAFLARRLGYGHDLARLCDDLTHHTTCVQELSTRLLG